MALQAENMSYEQLKEIVDGLTCRSISPLVLPQVPPGPFDLTCFPMTLMENVDNPGVHYFDVIGDLPGDIDYFALSSAYNLACEKKDLQFLPAPFGLRGTCPKETTIQIVILTRPDGHVSILKHLSFPDKLKPALIKKLTYGEVFKPQFMMSNPKNGRKILQIAWRIWGGGSLDAMSSPPKQFAKVAQSLRFHSRTKKIQRLMKASTIFSNMLLDHHVKWPNFGGKQKSSDPRTPQSLAGLLLLSARPLVTSLQMEHWPGRSSTGRFL